MDFDKPKTEVHTNQNSNIFSNSTNSYCSSFKKNKTNLKKLNSSAALKILVKNKKINFIKLLQEKFYSMNTSRNKNNSRCITKLDLNGKETNSNITNETKNIIANMKKNFKGIKRHKSISINSIKINNNFCFNNNKTLLGEKSNLQGLYFNECLLSPTSNDSLINSINRKFMNNKSNIYTNKNNAKYNSKQKNDLNKNIKVATKVCLSNMNKSKTKHTKTNNNNTNINININMNLNTERPRKAIIKHISNTSIPTPKAKEFSNDLGSINTKESSLAIGGENGTGKKKSENCNKGKFIKSDLCKKMENVKNRANNLLYKYSSLVEVLEQKLNIIKNDSNFNFIDLNLINLNICENRKKNKLNFKEDKNIYERDENNNYFYFINNNHHLNTTNNNKKVIHHIRNLSHG